MIQIAILAVALIIAMPAAAWTGETEDGDEVEITKYDHQGRGEGDAEWTDEEGEQHTGYLDMEPGGSGTLTDDETDEDIEVDMED